MTSSEWMEMIRLVPESEHGKLVIVLLNGCELCVDTVVRFEPTFLVMRGRQGGTIEEARGFFVPYEQMLCLRIERTIKIEELEGFFGGIPPVVKSTKETPIHPVSPNKTPVAAPTDAAAASRMLQERIRTMRASAAASTHTSRIG